MDALVSIIVPTYNRADKIVDCLESLLNQSYSRIEIIVVDDGSTDNTSEEINLHFSHALSGNKLYYFTQSNQGALVARNAGLAKAKGSLVVFFDSDDIMLPDRISKQVQSIVDNGSDCCTCGYIDSVNDFLYIPHLNPEKGSIGSLLAWHFMGSTQCWMYKRAVLEKFGGYDLNFRYYDDWLLTFRYLTIAGKVSVVSEGLSIYVNHHVDNRLTTDIADKEKLTCIQNYYLYVIKWMLTGKKELKHLDLVTFLYASQVMLKPDISLSEMSRKYTLFSKAIRKASRRLALKAKVLLFKHLFKSLAKNRILRGHVTTKSK